MEGSTHLNHLSSFGSPLYFLYLIFIDYFFKDIQLLPS